MEYKILGAKWWNNVDGSIGIVAVETKLGGGEWKAYIGIASGLHEKMDEQHVAAYGNGLQPEEAHGIFPYLDIEKYKAY